MGCGVSPCPFIITSKTSRLVGGNRVKVTLIYLLERDLKSCVCLRLRFEMDLVAFWLGSRESLNFAAIYC